MEEDDVILKQEESKNKIPVADRAMEVVLIILTIATFVSFFLIVVVF